MRGIQACSRTFAASLIAHSAATESETKDHSVEPYNKPQMGYDPNTISTCTFWYDNYRGQTCHSVRDYLYAIKPETFSHWNPSIGLDCSNWQEQSYCVLVGEKPPETTSTTRQPHTTSTSTSTHPPTATSWAPLGCYKDADPSTLDHQVSGAGGNNLTIENCEDACNELFLPFAGLKAGTECWCSDFVANDLTADQDDCNIPCGGNVSEMCGGISVINVFEGKTVDRLPPFTFDDTIMATYTDGLPDFTSGTGLPVSTSAVLSTTSMPDTETRSTTSTAKTSDSSLVATASSDNPTTAAATTTNSGESRKMTTESASPASTSMGTAVRARPQSGAFLLIKNVFQSLQML